MERIIRKNYKEYRAIEKGKSLQIETKDSGDFLSKIGIQPQVIITEGHSPDSISLVMDAHEAIIGDLSPIDQIMPEDARSQESWKRIKELRAKKIYPSHAAQFDI